MALQGKVCLVTGASQGVGRAVAAGLARRGADVVLLCRDAARGEATLEEIVRETGNKRVELLVADLSSQADVRRAAAAFRASHPRLDVLVNNAAVLPWTRRTTVDGIEESLAVNHLSHFLLTNLLLGELKAAAPSRVLNVTTTAHAKALDLDDLQMERRKYHVYPAYVRTKLLNVLFTYELARRLEGTGVTANAVHPANMVRSAGQREFQGALKVVMKLLGPAHVSPEKAAEEPLRVATAPELAGVSGKFFAFGKERRSAPVTHDEAVARRAWDASARLVGLDGAAP